MLREHPKGLAIIFFTEIWERFSYYGMRALLVLYMTKELLYQDEKAYAIYGAYTALVYATPVIGGFLADKILGQRMGIIMGAFMMMLGHFFMAIPDFFYPALGFLIVGNGLFKPGTGPIIGQLYEKDDPRRDGGFTIFYMAVNIGAIVAPLAGGYVGENYGWHYGFGLAGVGMLSGLLFFKNRQIILGKIGLPPVKSLEFNFLGLNKIHWTWVGAFVVVPIVTFLVTNPGTMNYLLGIVGSVVIAYILVNAFKSEKIERDRLLVATILTIYSVLFWAFFFQGGSSLTLFTERNINRTILGWTIKTSMLESVNPIFIILLASGFSSMWIKLNKMGKEPSTPLKFIFGTFFLGIGFGVFALGRYFAVDSTVPFVFLLGGYFFLTVGELSLSPVGLSMITKLSPGRMVGFMMGVWYLSAAFANHIAAFIATLTATGADGQAAITPAQTLAAYSGVFAKVFWICMGISALMLVLVKPMRKMMHGIH